MRALVTEHYWILSFFSLQQTILDSYIFLSHAVAFEMPFSAFHFPFLNRVLLQWECSKCNLLDYEVAKCSISVKSKSCC